METKEILTAKIKGNLGNRIEIIEQKANGEEIVKNSFDFCNTVFSFQLSPSGNLLAASSASLFSRSYYRSIRLWNAQSGILLKSFEIHSSSNRIKFSPDCKLVASLNNQMTVQIYDLESGKLTKQFDVNNQSTRSLQFSTDSRYLATGFDGTDVSVWNIESGSCLKTLNSQWLAFTVDNCSIKVLNVDSDEIAFSATRNSIKDLKFKNSCQLEIYFETSPREVIYWRNPILYAIKHDNIGELKSVYYYTELELEKSLFEICCIENSFQCAKYLIESKSIAESTIFDGLIVAINNHLNAFVIFLEKLTNLNIQDRKGKTLLHFAVAANNIQFTTELLRKGADLTITDRNGYTPENFVKSVEMKQIFANLQEIIFATTSKDNNFDWCSIKEYVAFVLQWRSSDQGSSLLHLAMKTAHQEAIFSILKECPSLLTTLDKNGLLPFQCFPDDAIGIKTGLLALSLSKPIPLVFDQVTLNLHRSLLLTKNIDNTFVYEGIDESMIDRFAKNQLESEELVANELNLFLKELFHYYGENPDSVNAKILKMSNSVKIFELDLRLQSEKAQGLLEATLTELETTVKIHLDDKSKQIDSEVFQSIVEKRDQALASTIAVIQQDLTSIPVFSSKIEEHIKSLQLQEYDLQSLAEEYTLLGLFIEETEEKGYSKDFEKLQELCDCLSSKNFKVSEKVDFVKELLIVIPKIVKTKHCLEQLCLNSIIIKLKEICEQTINWNQLLHKLKISSQKLGEQQQKYQSILNAIMGLDVIQSEFQNHQDLILDIEEKIAVLKLKQRRSFNSSELKTKLQTLNEEKINLKRNKNYISLRNELTRRSMFLPELQFRCKEINPLHELDVVKRYSTLDFEADYEVVSELSSRVIMAKNAEGTICVLKRFNAEDERSLLRHAVGIISRVSWHPNIININSIVDDLCNNQIYLEHPYFELGDLMQWRKSSKYSVEKIPKIFFDAVQGLIALHENGIIHRDIKPQNILVSPSGSVLTDFDFGEFQIQQTNFTRHATSLTPFTINFVAPEVFTGGIHSVSSDLYSLGLTFGYILTGCPEVVLKKIDDFFKIEYLSDNQKSLVSGLIEQNPTDRTSLKKVLKNPFIRGDIECAVCFDTKMLSNGLLCQPEKSHFVCHQCFGNYIKQEIEKDAAYLISTNGEILCPSTDGCSVGHFPFEYICENTSPEIIALYMDGKKKLIAEKAKMKENRRLHEIIKSKNLEQEEVYQKLQEALLGEKQSSREQMLQYLRTEQAFEDDYYTRECPECQRVIQKFEGCNSIQCGQDYHGGNVQYGCGARFNFSTAPRYKSKVVNLNEMIRELSSSQLSRRNIR